MHQPRRWPEIVGYRFEVLHTGVLAELLNGATGSQVAAALVGNARAAGSVGDVVFEPRIGSSSRKADLRFSLEERPGTVTAVLVETKVDSVPGAEQLEHMAKQAEGARLVYLSVGYSTYLLPVQRRLFRDGGWSVVTVDEWLTLLDGLELTGDLATYRECVRDEVRRHADTLDLVAHTDWRERLDAADVDARTRWGARVRWIDEVRNALAADDPGWWDETWAAETVNGTQFGREIKEWKAKFSGEQHANVYIEVIANHEAQWLALKSGGSTAELRRRIDVGPIIEALARARWTPGRRSSDSYKTQTLGTLVFDGDPAQAAETIREERHRLDDVVRACVAEAQR
jgi:hypothetical protein